MTVGACMRAYVFYVQACVVAYVFTFACLFMPEDNRGGRGGEIGACIVDAPGATEL